MSRTFDRLWEERIYSRGLQLNRYPFDAVVSFVYKNIPDDRPRNKIRILEVGCGAGNNLWFMAREGFCVAGIDASHSAIDFARKRMAEEGLDCDLRIGDFTDLPFREDYFDLVVDRAAITYCGFTAARRAVADIRAALRPQGRFFFNPYGTLHSSYLSGRAGPDGLRVDISGGTLIGSGDCCFYDRKRIEMLFDRGWRLLQLKRLELMEELQSPAEVHAEWQVVVEKTPE